ncbi:DUF3455 domain-containing protein [Acidobacteria bacterium AB60]|nr:DUF3455 domain-containing protein [Acidobacteria bacterium AB60]
MKVAALALMGFVVSAQVIVGQQPSTSIDVPEGAHSVLQARGEGVQVYSCNAAPSGQKWTLKGPDAKLLDSSGQVIGTHFAGPTWKLNDGGQVQGEAIGNKASPEAGAVPWLLLRAKPGTGTGSLAGVGYIRRTETHGGAAPGTGCDAASDAGKTVQIPYSATYTFYEAKKE